MEGVIALYTKEWDTLKRNWPIALGLLVAYVPTLFRLADTIWPKAGHGHEPFVLVVVGWLFWKSRHDVSHIATNQTSISSILLLMLGCLFYAIGRSQTIVALEVASLLPVLAGTVLMLKGAEGLKRLAFPIAFIIFLIPVPGFIVDTLTGPLKQVVSLIVSEMLHFAGFPIARAGALLVIGPYQLLVADACSGLNSLFTLTALGCLFIHLKHGRWTATSFVLLAAVLPIAFAANIGRVILLTLVTYYFGDTAGQAFTHDFAAIAEFVVAITLLFWVDIVLTRWLLKRYSGAQ